MNRGIPSEGTASRTAVGTGGHGLSRRAFIPGALATIAAGRQAWAGEVADGPHAADGDTRKAGYNRRPLFQLTPFNTGECKIGKNHVLGAPHSDDERVDFTIYSFLADGGPGRRVLIDLGPVGLAYLNAMFRRFGFFRDLPGDPDAIRQPHGNVFDWLRRLRLKPADIDHIVFTHMHADHHGLTDAKDGGGAVQFSRAKIHVSRIGWQDNLDKRVEGKWHSYVDYAFADYLLEGERRGQVVFHDNDEVLPGIDVIYTGGHSVCSQLVRVGTEEGPAIVTGDEIYHYALFEKGILARLHTTPEKQLAASEKLADLATKGAILVPCHDPVLSVTYETAGDAWLRRLKPVSQAAARGFKAAPKRVLERTDRDS